MTEGSVEVVLSGSGGEEVFRVEEPARPGIWNATLRPTSPGEFDLAFRIASPAGTEEIRGGRVRVGTADAPGGLAVAPAPRGAQDGGVPLSFLKEEQWRSDFSTDWVRRSRFDRSVASWGTIRPPAGGETTVTSPVDGILQAGTWPFPGQRVEAGAPLFQVVPRVAAERSLAALEAELAGLDTELGPARSRLARLEELLALEATSVRETEEARARVETLEARRSAAANDLAAARSAREGGTAGALTVRAPFRGEIASVNASPGMAVDAGTPLARLVRTDLLWIEAALTPADARQLQAETGVAGLVVTPSQGSAVHLDDARLIAIAPEADAATGTVTVLLEAPPTAGLTLGTTAEVRILIADAGEDADEGIVVPATALVDDGGVTVAYLQLSGESFARQQVHVLERQGDRVLVERLVPGQRLVTRGGDAIRRSSLMASGEAHGHVH